MEKSIVFVGGTGFIGINLANYFSHLGYKVGIIGRNVISLEKLASQEIEVSYFDIKEMDKLLKCVKDYENIVWLATSLIPSSSISSLNEDFLLNIKPLINFLELNLNLTGLKKFIFISSGGAIYGNSSIHKPLIENSNLMPISTYGLSKLLSEKYIHFLSKKNLFNSIILRPSNVYGSNQNLNRPQGIVGFLFDSIINNKKVTIYDHGNSIRDFLYIDDLSNALKLSIEADNFDNNCITYNVGTNIGLSISDLIKLVSKITNEEISFVNKPARITDCNYNVLNIDKIRLDLNWEPLMKIEKGLKVIWSNLTKEKIS